jgi:glycosyltransferase involved in cell wall biosynthesis
MSRLPQTLKISVVNRHALRKAVPYGVRRSMQPLIRRLMEYRVASALRAVEPSQVPGPLIVSGLLSEAKGVSEGARLTLAAFAAAGLDPLPHDLRPLFAGKPGASDLLTKTPGGVWFAHVNAPEALQALGRLDPVSWRGRHRIGYWAYELPRVPPEWVRIASAFHEIWVPSQFVADSMLGSGIKVPVRLMPHPVALGHPKESPDRDAFGIPAGTFAVLTLGDLQSSATRKNLTGAIEMFQRAFPTPGNATLIMKIRDDIAHPGFLAHARKVAGDRVDIRFMTGDLAAREMRQLVASCDLLLSPHRSEGFGLPLAEAFLAGVPALATGWSGNLEFMVATPELLLPYSLIGVNDAYGVYRASGQKWAEPDIEDGAQRLRQLAAAPGLRRELAAKGKAAVEAFSLPWRRQALLGLPVGQLTAPGVPLIPVDGPCPSR